MATEKTPNYTPEQTTQMVADYQGGATVEAIAQALGKTVRSVVAKLSREGVYKKKEYTTKTGEKPVKKDEHADRIGALVGLSEGEVDSLTKANKTALRKIVERIEADAKRAEELLAEVDSAFDQGYQAGNDDADANIGTDAHDERDGNDKAEMG